jgi:pre-mRNA 3'-end-processing factor FIP1
VTERKDDEEPSLYVAQAPHRAILTKRRDDASKAATASGKAENNLATQSATTADPSDPSARPAGLTAAQQALKSGKSFPEVRTSQIDVSGDPVYAPVGKPISQVEIDADLAEHEKPWRRPGADQADYFNYGFDEFTWSTYCLRQKTMAEAIVEQKAENEKFEMMFGGGMVPGMPGAAAAAPAAAAAAMGGGGAGGAGMQMPNQQDFQRAMMQAMEEQGTSDPNQLDFSLFMSRMQGGGGGGMANQGNIPSGPASQQQGGYGGGGNWQQQQGGYGRGGKRQQRW